jgi:hypothetical protein
MGDGIDKKKKHRVPLDNQTNFTETNGCQSENKLETRKQKKIERSEH